MWVVTTSWTKSRPICRLTPRLSFSPQWPTRATNHSRAFVQTTPGLLWLPRGDPNPVNNRPATSRAFLGLMGGAGVRILLPPASPASSLAPFSINRFSGCCKHGNINFPPSRGLPRFLPRVYSHQNAPGRRRRGNILFSAVPRLPPSSSRLFSSKAPPGSSARDNYYFRMSRPFPPATYLSPLVSLPRVFHSHTIYYI